MASGAPPSPKNYTEPVKWGTYGFPLQINQRIKIDRLPVVIKTYIEFVGKYVGISSGNMIFKSDDGKEYIVSNRDSEHLRIFTLPKSGGKRHLAHKTRKQNRVIKKHRNTRKTK